MALVLGMVAGGHPAASQPPSDPTDVLAPGTPPDCHPDWRPAQPLNQLGTGLGEMSGFVASPVHPQWGWGVRDSGNPPSLYAIRPSARGDVETRELRAYELHNSDWEDVAYTPGPPGVPGFPAGPGHLWVLENVGNGWSGNRWIYEFEELDPDPLPPSPSTTTTTTTAPLQPPPPAPATLVGAYQWAYPDEQANTETMFVFDGDLVVVSKTTPGRVYRFDAPLSPSIVNVPRFVGTLPAGNTLSVATLSADQRTLAVSNHVRVDVYENRDDVRDLEALISNPVFHQDLTQDNREAGSFFPYGSCDLLLVAESKNLWRLKHR